MNLQDVFNELNFYINQFTGSWFTIPELENLTDIGQMAVYSDFKPKYAASQLVKDAMSPFRSSYNFTTQVSGYVIVPDTTYLDLLDIQIYFQISNRTVYYPIQLVNEDERANKLNSQLNPVTVTSPIGEQTAPRTFRLYPASAYNGNVTYLRRPIKPVFGYSVISGRVIVYNPNTSTQLEWRDSEIDLIIIKAVKAAGYNLGAKEVQAWAEAQSQGNYLNQNRL